MELQESTGLHGSRSHDEMAARMRDVGYEDWEIQEEIDLKAWAERERDRNTELFRAGSRLPVEPNRIDAQRDRAAAQEAEQEQAAQEPGSKYTFDVYRDDGGGVSMFALDADDTLVWGAYYDHMDIAGKDYSLAALKGADPVADGWDGLDAEELARRFQDIQDRPRSFEHIITQRAGTLPRYTENSDPFYFPLFTEGYELPEGWQWACYNDGSGSLRSPAGDSYFSYDLSTMEMMDETGEYTYVKNGDWIKQKLEEAVLPDWEDRRALKAEHPDWWRAYGLYGKRILTPPDDVARIVLAPGMDMDAQEFRDLLGKAHQAERSSWSDHTLDVRRFAAKLAQAWPEAAEYEGETFEVSSMDGAMAEKRRAQADIERLEDAIEDAYDFGDFAEVPELKRQLGDARRVAKGLTFEAYETSDTKDLSLVVLQDGKAVWAGFGYGNGLPGHDLAADIQAVMEGHHPAEENWSYENGLKRGIDDPEGYLSNLRESASWEHGSVKLIADVHGLRPGSMSQAARHILDEDRSAGYSLDSERRDAAAAREELGGQDSPHRPETTR